MVFCDMNREAISNPAFHPPSPNMHVMFFFREVVQRKVQSNSLRKHLRDPVHGVIALMVA